MAMQHRSGVAMLRNGLRRAASHSDRTAARTARANSLMRSSRTQPTAIARLARAFSTSTEELLAGAAQALRSDSVAAEDKIAAMQKLQVDATDAEERGQQAQLIVESQTLPSLLAVLRAGQSAPSELVVPAYLSLISISSEPRIAAELFRLDAPEIIAPYLKSKDARLQAAACLTLGNLALGSTLDNVLNTPSVLPNLLLVLSSPHEAIQRAAVACLGNIAGSPHGRDALCESDAIFSLCDLLTDAHGDQLRGAAAFALGNMLSGRDIAVQDTLRGSGGLADLILLLSPAFPEEVGSSAAWAIHHGVHLNPQSQTMLGEAGGLNLLLQQVPAVSDSLQTNALLALNSAVLDNDANLKWCAENEVKEMLEIFLEEEGDDMSANAKQALQELVQELF